MLLEVNDANENESANTTHVWTAVRSCNAKTQAMIAEIFISLCLSQDWKRKGKQEKRGHPAVILINHCKIACLNSNPCAWENVMKWLNFEQRSPLRWSVLKQETLRYKWVPKTNTLRLVRTCQSNASGVQTQLKCKCKHSWPQGLGLFFLFVCLFFGPGGGALNTNASANCKDYYARMGICSGFFFPRWLSDHA